MSENRMGTVCDLGTADEFDGMKNRYINFSVQSEVYGIEARHVLRIIGVQDVTGAPDVPLYLKGFVNFRGGRIPVVSMRACFGEAENGYSDRTRVVILEDGDRSIGLIVDAIQETLTIAPERILPADPDETPFVVGAARLGDDRTTMIIHVQALLAALLLCSSLEQ